MTEKFDNYLGNIEISRPDSWDGDPRRFFPIQFFEDYNIKFFPKKPEFATEKHRDSLIDYLKHEGYLRDDGNFLIEVIEPTTA